MPVIQIHRAKNRLKVRIIGSRERMAKKDYRRCLKTIPSPLRRISNRATWNPSSRLQHTICLGERENIPIIQLTDRVIDTRIDKILRAVVRELFCGPPQVVFGSKISFTTTAFAAIETPSATVMPPISLAPVPMNTLLPTIGERLLPPVAPRFTHS